MFVFCNHSKSQTYEVALWFHQVQSQGLEERHHRAQLFGEADGAIPEVI